MFLRQKLESEPDGSAALAIWRILKLFLDRKYLGGPDYSQSLSYPIL